MLFLAAGPHPGSAAKHRGGKAAAKVFVIADNIISKREKGTMQRGGD
jgi:hypothetical protein